MGTLMRHGSRLAGPVALLAESVPPGSLGGLLVAQAAAKPGARAALSGSECQRTPTSYGRAYSCLTDSAEVLDCLDDAIARPFDLLLSCEPANAKTDAPP